MVGRKLKIVMKNIISIIILGILVLGCDTDSTDDISFITNYPTFDLNGDAWEFGEVNTGVGDPGVTVYEGQNEIDFSTEGTVDPNTVGFYPITYSATNQDGFDGEFERIIWIYPPDAESVDISGTYTGSYLRTSTGETYTTTGLVIEKVGVGLYSVSDLFAGYYVQVFDNDPTAANPGYLFHVGGGDFIVAPNDPDIFGDRLYGSMSVNMDGSFSLDLYDEGFDWTQDFEFVKE